MVQLNCPSIREGGKRKKRENMPKWPWRRQPTGSRPPVCEDIPDSIPIYGTDHEAAIVALLERAQDVAANKQSGEPLSVTLDGAPQDYYGSYVFPIMFRAAEYGLLPLAAYSNRPGVVVFGFVKL